MDNSQAWATVLKGQSAQFNWSESSQTFFEKAFI